MQYYINCKYLQLLFCILFFLSTLYCFVWCKLILFGKYCSHRTISIVSIVTFVNKCCVLKRKKKKNLSMLRCGTVLGCLRVMCGERDWELCRVLSSGCSMLCNTLKSNSGQCISVEDKVKNIVGGPS